MAASAVSVAMLGGNRQIHAVCDYERATDKNGGFMFDDII